MIACAGVILRAGPAALAAGPVLVTLAMLILAALPLADAGCSAISPNRVRPDFDLSKCETLEPGLFRCNGFDAPLCDDAFTRNNVECFKISRDGMLAQDPATQ
jgi:hypothetical protein